MTDMLTAKDMQDLLQVDRSTVYRMAERQQIPALKVGKQWRFPSDQVEQWLKGQASVTTPEPIPAPSALPSVPTGDDLADLLPLDCVQLIQDTFATTLEVMLVITDMQGQPITEFSNPCGLFEAISQTPDAVKKCIDSWHDLAVMIDLEPKLTPSHLGLLCARGLIRVGTELKGMVVVGGIAPQNWPPSPEAINGMAAEFGVTPETLESRLDEVFYLSQAEKDKVLSTLQRIANIIAHIVNERSGFMQKLDAIALLSSTQ